MISEAALVLAMEKAAPCGRSAWSVEPVPVAECAPDAAACAGAKRSSFYRGWVRKESAATCKVRRDKMAHALALEARDAIEAGLVLGIAVNESGLREDVMMGRGRSGRTKRTDKQYDDAGGQGRGPSNEACVMQIIPSMAREYGGAEALLGDSEGALRLCFRAGIAQLRYSRAMCSVRHRIRVLPTGEREDVGPLFATISRYGTGHSCTSENDGKTARRVKTVRWMTAVIQQHQGAS